MIRSFPVVELEDRPTTPSKTFLAWVRGYGTSRLARSLGIDRASVSHWISRSDAWLPRREMVAQIIGLSQIEPCGVGPLGYEDIYGPVMVRRVETKTAQIERRWQS